MDNGPEHRKSSTKGGGNMGERGRGGAPGFPACKTTHKRAESYLCVCISLFLFVKGRQEPLAVCGPFKGV